MRRKLFLGWLLVITILRASAQTEIQLIIKGENIDKIDVYDLSQTESQGFDYRDSVSAFFTKNHIDCYSVVYRSGNKKFLRQLWLNSGKIKVYGHVDSVGLRIDTVVNAPAYYETNFFLKEFSRLTKSKDTTSLNHYLLETVRRYSASPFYIVAADFYLNINQNHPANLIPLKQIVDGLSEKFEWFLFYPGIEERMEKILNKVSVNADDYLYTDLRGEQTKMSLTGGGYYVLDFWFLECPPCRKDHIAIKEAEALLKKNNVKMIGVSTDKDYDQWKAYIEKHDYSWSNYLQDSKKNISADLGLFEYPTYIILDKNGAVVGTYNTFESIKSKLLVKD